MAFSAKAAAMRWMKVALRSDRPQDFNSSGEWARMAGEVTVPPMKSRKRLDTLSAALPDICWAMIEKVSAARGSGVSFLLMIPREAMA